MTSAGRTRLAVLGSPIGHSRSPLLHRAAYRALGLDWTYDPIELTEADLSAFVSSMDRGWRGLSLTMPLKRGILPLLDRTDPVAELTGSANTALIADDGIAGFNTDVFGIVETLRSVPAPRIVQVLGAGATAASAIVAVAELGARSVHISARSPEKAASLTTVAEKVGIALTIGDLEASAPSYPDLVISALPGGTDPGIDFPDALMDASTLLDVSYDPWPGPVSGRWVATGGRAISGIEMLVNQALAQVRIFVAGDPSIRLDDEQRVRSAMRASVGLEPSPFDDD